MIGRVLAMAGVTLFLSGCMMTEDESYGGRRYGYDYGAGYGYGAPYGYGYGSSRNDDYYRYERERAQQERADRRRWERQREREENLNRRRQVQEVPRAVPVPRPDARPGGGRNLYDTPPGSRGQAGAPTPGSGTFSDH